MAASVLPDMLISVLNEDDQPAEEGRPKIFRLSLQVSLASERIWVAEKIRIVASFGSMAEQRRTEVVNG